MANDVREYNDELLTVRDVAKTLRVSINCVYELVGKGRLASYRVGAGRGTIRVRREDVRTYLEGCRVENEEPKRHVPRPRLKHLTL